MLCNCGKKCPQWVSWSDDHPAIRFHNCPDRSAYNLRRKRGRGGGDENAEIGCGFFMFCESDIVGKGREVILGIRDRQIELYKENEMLKKQNPSLLSEVSALKAKNVYHETEIEALNVEKIQLMCKVKELEK